MSYLLDAVIKEQKLRFTTLPGLFSPKNIDKGTLAMLEHVDFDKEEKILDLGCGYGVVGILAAKLIGEVKVVMCEIDEIAVQISGENASLNGVPNIKILQ